MNNILHQRGRVRETKRTPENVVLVVLVRFGPHFDETREPLSHHKLVHQIFVILEETK